MFIGCQGEPLNCSNTPSLYPISSLELSSYLPKREPLSFSEKLMALFQNKCRIWTLDKGAVPLLRSDVLFSLKKHGESESATKASILFARMIYLHALQRRLNEDSITEEDIRKIVSFPTLGVRLTERKGATMVSNIFYKYSLSCSHEAPPAAQDLVHAFSRKYQETAVPYRLVHSRIPSICSHGILCSASHILKIASSLQLRGFQPEILRFLYIFSEYVPFPKKQFIPYQFFFLIGKWAWIEKQLPPQIKLDRHAFAVLYKKQDSTNKKKRSPCLFDKTSL